VLVILLCGTLVLLTGPSLVFWGFAMFLCGSYDGFRMLATGVVNRSFGRLPAPWGYALFDSIMGLPMAGGALLGGALFRVGASAPFVFVVVVAAALIVVLVVGRPAPLVRAAPDAPDGITDVATEALNVPARGDGHRPDRLLQ